MSDFPRNWEHSRRLIVSQEELSVPEGILTWEFKKCEMRMLHVILSCPPINRKVKH